MIRVNLVPQEILAGAAQRQLLMQGSAAGALFLAVLAGVSVQHWYGKHRLDQDLSYSEAELQRLSKIVSQVEELEAASSAVKSRLGVIDELLRGRGFYPVFMSDFARTVPTGVRIQQMTAANSSPSSIKLNISAQANANGDIAAWVRALEETGRFSGVEMGAVSASGRIFNFTLLAVYTNKL